MAHKEHGEANARSREGSRQAHLGAECGGCRAPPQQSLSNSKGHAQDRSVMPPSQTGFPRDCGRAGGARCPHVTVTKRVEPDDWDCSRGNRT